ncbi:MAG: hypothetical protein ACTTH7_04315 [Treponema sp.]
MASTIELSDILRAYALRFNTPSIGISDFCEYIHKYAHRYTQEHPEFTRYTTISEENLLAELQSLENEGKTEILEDKKKGKFLFLPYYFLDKISRQYDAIREKAELPFPLVNEIPQSFSKRFVRSVRINVDFTEMQPEQGNNSFLYQLIFPDDTPPLIFPGNFSTDQMLELALAKLRYFFQKDAIRDFVQKKLIAANPGKEYSIRKFIGTIQAHSSEALYTLKKSGDVYLFWSYLCSIVKQEFAKKVEKLIDEIAILQALFIIEYLNNHYKNQTQQNLQRETALKNLELSFQKKPYYFNKAAIIAFKDYRGIPLLGQYSEADLENYMQTKTTQINQNTLPDLLSFKTAAGDRYYVLLDRVVPLIVSLVNENRKKIRDICLKKWYQQLLQFEQSEAMHTDSAFNQFLRDLCLEYVPILYDILNASFISSISTNASITANQLAEVQRIFSNNKLLSYQELFMLNRQELLTDTRILLPFWYTVPVISSIIAFFMRPRKKNNTTAKKEKKTGENQTTTRKVTPKEIAEELQKEFVPADKTLQDCIIEQLDLWNTNIDPVMRKQNTDNVNSFIRDYVKTANKTVSGSLLTAERVHSLAESIIDAKSLSQVKNRTALQLYVEYYILWLIRNAS